ncbi:MAG: S-layer family protein, partial [Burkholderiales bacterium]|nr:S-layer family protein [Burkholderiales bacterium]
TISSAKDVGLTNTFKAASLTQTAGTGTTTIDGSVTTTNVAGISITNVGGIAINDNVANSAGGNITFTTTAATADISIAANKSVTSTGGNGLVSFSAGRTIALAAGATVSTANGGAGTGTITFNAGQAAAGNITLGGDSVVQTHAGAIALTTSGGTSSSITMADVVTTNAARVLSASGAVTLSASLNVALGVVSTGSTVGVTAGTGSISDNTAGETIANITGTNVTLDAGSAIGGTGVGADIDTSISAVKATAAGNLVLRQLSGGGDLAIGVSGGGISSSGGDVVVRVDAGSLNINQAVSTSGAGNVALKAAGGSSDVNVNGVTVASASGNLQVISGRHILTSTTTGTTTEFSTSGTLLLDAQDSIGTTGSRIDTTVGTLAAKSAGVSAAGDVFLNQTAGALTVGTATGLDGRANLSGIATGANNNDVTLVSAGAVTVTQNVTANGSGNVALKTTGANDVNINGATVSSTTGNLQVISGRHILTNTATGTTNEFATAGAGTLLLDAQDSIGTTANHIDTVVPTVAAVSAGVSAAGDIFLNQTAGALTVGTATGLDGRANLSGIVTSANSNDITLVSRAGSITVTGAIGTNGDALLRALGASSDVTISNNIVGTGAAAGKTVTLQADRNIVFNFSADISTNNVLNVVLNSDFSDGNNAGAIQLNSGTVINSNGGSITLGGGSNPLTTAAIGTSGLADGVKLDNAQLIAGTGNINIRGTGASAGGIGVNLLNSSSITSTGTAAILITGTGTAGNNDIKVASGSNSIGGASASGDILLNGTTGGGMVLGAGGGDSTTVQTTGNITLNQTGGGVSQGSGTLLANGLRLIGSGAFSLNQASNNVNVLVADLTGSATTLSYRDANGFSIGSAGTGGLSTVKTAGTVADTTNGITVGTAATAANTLTLNAFGAVTQATAVDNVTAGGLQLLGNGPYTLANAGNDITTFAAKVAGDVSYRDANGFTVGIVADAPTSVSTTGITTTGGGAVTLDNAGVLTLAQNVSTDGAFAQISSAGAGMVSIASPRSISTTGDAVSFASAVTLNGAGTTTIDTTTGSNAAGANVTFSSTLNGTTNSAENLTVTAGSGGAVTFNGSVGATRLGNVTITRAKDLTIQSGFNAKTLTQSQGATGAPSTTPSSGATTINGAVNTTGNTSLATSGELNVTGAGSITAGAGSTVTLTAGGDMRLSGSVTAPAGATLNVTGTDRILKQTGGTVATTNSAVVLIADEMELTSAINSGSGAVTLKPNNPADAIQLGVATAATNNAAATLELSDSELNTITTTGGLTVGASNNTGAITVAGVLTPTTAQNGLTLLNRVGGIAVNAAFTYTAGNGNLTLTANGGGATGGAITANGGVLDVSGILAMNAATGVGTLASPMVLSHAAGTTLRVTNTTSGGVFVRADSGDLNIDAINNLAPTGAGINLNVGTNLNINGTVENAAGDIQFVTGNDTAYTAADGFGLSPASVAVGTLGGVNINGRVIANNGGAISIFATGAVKQNMAVAAGLQSIPTAGTDARGALKVRTFNSGTQVGVIDLQNNLADSGNSMGPITLEARLAGSLNPPPYAESNIDYKSINGTSISGIGTAADFSLVAPSQTIDLAPGASLSGTNISLIATAGDVTVKSAITNAQINGGQSGGSLNLYATGNIILNNPGGDSAGVVIGKDLGTLDEFGDRQFEKFDHILKLVATGDIRIFGTVQVTGDLALRANASASEASGPGGVAGFGAGSGSVLIAGSEGNPVEVRARNIVVGARDANGNLLPVQNLIIDNSANVADSGQFFDTILRADSKLDIYLNGDQGGAGTSGNIVITGGSATASSTGVAGEATKSSALAVIRGDVISILGVKGGTQGAPNLNTKTWKKQDPGTPDPTTQTVNPSLPYTTNSSSIIVNGGVATSNTAAGGGALAAADALILGTNSKFIDIGGNIELMGGTANSSGGGQTSASAKIDPVNLRINTGGYIKLVGGEGGGARAALLNSGDMEINIGGKFDYTYTDASGTHTVKDVGLLLVGGLGSGLYDRDNQLIKTYYDVSSQILLLFPAINGGPGGGSYFLQEDLTKASAFMQSLSPRGFDDSLMAYIIFAANEETRTGHINTAVSKDDDANKPSCN